MYLQIFCALKSKDLNERSFFVFHGFHPRFHRLKGKHGHKEEMSCDFVLVFPGLIIGIECKNTLSDNTYAKAIKQLDKLQKVLEEELGTGNNFKFIKCIAYHTPAENFKASEACKTCAQYLLRDTSQDTILKKLMLHLRDTPLKPKTKACGAAFKGKVRDLLLFTSEKKRGSDAANRVAGAYHLYHTCMETTPREAVFFWNPTQYDVIQSSPRFCTIDGGRSTPETIIWDVTMPTV